MHDKKKISEIVLSAVCNFLAALFCFAQTQTARLQGIVNDATGAVVANAKVVAVQDETKDSADATSNASGLYVLPALRPGTNPSLAISTPSTFGKISSVVNNPRLLQAALRFEW